jgi:peptidoglycan hydrolase-like protein with peptidoglycan-binding domain
VCLVLVVAAGTTLLVVRPWHHASTAAAAPSYTCHVTRAADGWYAGMTRTRTALVQQGMAGPQVAEVQCLLRRAGFSPGEIDGIFGVLTQRAVQRIQAAHGLPVDGMVGPQTWGALRA